MRRLAIPIILLLPALTWANGAMGLGLEMFHFGYWLVYVVAMIVFEAWWIGRKSGVSWGASLGISFLGNLITAMLCSQMAAPALHQPVWGSKLNPNPFLNAIALFLIYGLISAVIEAGLWQMMTKKERILGRSLTAHILSIPIALAILLISEHPYAGLDAFTHHPRRWILENWAKRQLQDQIMEQEKVPAFSTVEEAIRALPPEDTEAWTAAYYPNFGRFAFGETRSVPYLWNTALNGKEIGGEEENWVWLIRPPKGEYQRVIEVDLSTGQVRARLE